MSEGMFEAGDGCPIAWRMDGPEGAPVLLLSNSLGVTMGMWAPQMEALAQRFRVLRYDSRGHGRSGAPAGSYSLDRLVLDAIELLDGLGIGRVSYCGLSKGGMVGQLFAARAPERIEKLVLCNTSAYMGPPSSWQARIATVNGQGMNAIADAVIERWFTPGFREASPDAVAPVRDMLLATAPQGYAGCCAAIRDMDLRNILSLIRVPTLIIAGDQDPATPLEHSTLLNERIAGSKMVVLSAAHLSNVERPEEFTRALMGFLEA